MRSIRTTAGAAEEGSTDALAAKASAMLPIRNALRDLMSDHQPAAPTATTAETGGWTEAPTATTTPAPAATPGATAAAAEIGVETGTATDPADIETISGVERVADPTGSLVRRLTETAQTCRPRLVSAIEAAKLRSRGDRRDSQSEQQNQ